MKLLRYPCPSCDCELQVRQGRMQRIRECRKCKTLLEWGSDLSRGFTIYGAGRGEAANADTD